MIKKINHIILSAATYVSAMLLITGLIIAPVLVSGQKVGSVYSDQNYVTGGIKQDFNLAELIFKGAPVDIINWNFPNSPDDQIADGGITANLSKTISRESGFSGSYSYVAGSTTYAISTNTWNGGTGIKYWEVEFSTENYDSIKVSSKQRSSNTGPRDFKVQYSLDNTNWYDITGGSITTGDNWTAGVLPATILPTACWDQTSVRLRWIMTSDVSVSGGTVASTGTSRIDDIYVTGVLPPAQDTIAPIVTKAYALTDSTVAVIFTEAVDTTSATTIANYAFKGTTGILSIARPLADSVVIKLNPKLSVGIADTLSINYVVDTAGNAMDSLQAFKIIYNITQDTIAPYVKAAYATSLSTIEIVFSEPVDIVSAEDIINYVLLKGNVNDSVAELNAGQDTIILTLFMPGLHSGDGDTLMISGIEDLAGNPMDSTQKFPVIFTVKDYLVYWNFPNDPDDQIADGGININLNRTIDRESGFSGSYTYQTGPTTRSISTTGWQSGNGFKYWMISFSSSLFPSVYDSLKLSSKQYSSSTGPTNFEVQYSTDNSNWYSVPGTTLTVQTNWTSGVLNDVPLPVNCWGQPNVYLRWIMTSDVSVSGGTVSSTGTSRIDDIYVNGLLITGIQEVEVPGDIVIFPNPANDLLNISVAQGQSYDIMMSDIRGRKVFSINEVNSNITVDVSSYPAGIYILSAYDKKSDSKINKKIIVR